MDHFCLIAIMLFAMQHDMVDCSVIDVINAIDNERGIIPRVDYLEIIFSDAMEDYIIRGISYGEYNKYLDNEVFPERVLPF